MADDAMRAFGRHFSDIRPAVTLVEIARLARPTQLIEIEAEAIVGAAASRRELSADSDASSRQRRRLSSQLDWSTFLTNLFGSLGNIRLFYGISSAASRRRELHEGENGHDRMTWVIVDDNDRATGLKMLWDFGGDTAYAFDCTVASDASIDRYIFSRAHPHTFLSYLEQLTNPTPCARYDD